MTNAAGLCHDCPPRAFPGSTSAPQPQAWLWGGELCCIWLEWKASGGILYVSASTGVLKAVVWLSSGEVCCAWLAWKASGILYMSTSTGGTGLPKAVVEKLDCDPKLPPWLGDGYP